MRMPSPAFRHSLVAALVSVSVCVGPAVAVEPHWGRLYTVSGTVPVRENPTDTAIQVRALKAGQKVRVDFPDDGWAAVFDPKEPVRSELRALGYARLAELKSKGTLELAQASSIEVRKSSPDAKLEVVVDGKPVNKAKPATKGTPGAVSQLEAKNKPEAKIKPESKIKPDAKVEAQAKAEATPKASTAKDASEIRIADRQLTVRAKRDKDSEFRKVLRQGQRVRVSSPEDGWFAVFDLGEKSHDLSKALGYSRDKYLVPESAYTGPPLDTTTISAATSHAAAPVSGVAGGAPGKAQKSKAEAQDDDAVGYSVLERKEENHSAVPTVILRVRLELAQAPSRDAMRKIAREIWKAERKKNENLQLELLLAGMDPHALAYATARFHDDGRLREFWWRDVVLGKPKK